MKIPAKKTSLKSYRYNTEVSSLQKREENFQKQELEPAPMVLQQFILLLRNTSKVMNNLQVMIPGRGWKKRFERFEKKGYKNVIKKMSHVMRNTDMTGSGTIMFLFSLYFQRKTTTTLHRHFLPFFPSYVAGGENAIACL